MEDFNEYYSKLNSINTGKEEEENEVNQKSLAEQAKDHAIGGLEEGLGLPLAKDVLTAGMKKLTKSAVDATKKGLSKAGTKLRDAIRNKKPSTNDDTQDGTEMQDLGPRENPPEEGLDDEEVPEEDSQMPEETSTAEQNEGLDDDEVQDDADEVAEEEPEEVARIGQDMVPEGAGNIGEGIPNRGGMTEEEARRFTQGDDSEATERTAGDERTDAEDRPEAQERSGNEEAGENEEESANSNTSQIEQETADADEGLEEGGDDAVSGLTDALEASTATDETGVGDLVSGAIGLGLLFASFGEMFKHHDMSKPTVASPSTQFGV